MDRVVYMGTYVPTYSYLRALVNRYVCMYSPGNILMKYILESKYLQYLGRKTGMLT